MDADAKVLTALILTIGAVILGVSWAVAWHGVTTHRAAIEAGYEQSTLPGESSTHWVKPLENQSEKNK